MSDETSETTNGEGGALPSIDRRQFLQLGGLSVAGLALAGSRAGPLLAASGRGARADVAAAANVPAYIPPPHLPPPDAPGSALVPALYTKLPAKLVDFYPKGYKPASGGAISAFVPLGGPPPTALSSNKWWQAINKAYGAPQTPILVPGDSYVTKQAAAIASGNIGDMMCFVSPTPDFLQLLQHDFENLTPYLAGHNVAKYPGLAQNPTLTWKNSMINGEIWGVPQSRPLSNSAYIYRTDLLAKVGGTLPKNGAEFTALCKELTQGNQWALSPGYTGATLSKPFMWDFFFQMFGIPNQWAETGGRFTSFLEVPEVPDALNYMVKLNQAGYYYPGGPTSLLAGGGLLGSGKVFLWGAGGIGAYIDFLPGGPFYVNRHSSQVAGMVPPPVLGSPRSQVYWNQSGVFGVFTAIKRAPASRVEEMLRVMDYAAAPFGTNEWMLNIFGVEGVDYTIKNGSITSTNVGSQDIGSDIVGYYCAPPIALGLPWGFDNAVVSHAMYDYCVATTRVGINNPATQLYSPTFVSQGSSLATYYTGAISDIVAGRSPVSSWPSVVNQWRSQGGNAIKSELEHAYALANK
jgi:putative aldouronate transport system substrate-binding protein